MWIETTPKGYSALYEYFKRDLTVFASITDIDGTSPYGTGQPHQQTDWGSPDKSYPALRCDQTKETPEQKEWDVKFYIYFPEPEDLTTPELSSLPSIF